MYLDIRIAVPPLYKFGFACKYKWMYLYIFIHVYIDRDTDTSSTDSESIGRELFQLNRRRPHRTEDTGSPLTSEVKRRQASRAIHVDGLPRPSKLFARAFLPELWCPGN